MKRLLLFLMSCLLVVGSVGAQTLTPTPSYDPSEWYMAGANPQRTSWVSEEVRGSLSPEWYVPIEPYIPYYYQVIAADDKLFISTARGLYVFAYDTGTLLWVYPTELPLGHEPTVIKNNQGEYIVYVGGFDKKVHAIKANPQHLMTDPTTTQPMIDKASTDVLWTFDSVTHDPEGLGGGFNVNPLVITVPTVGQVLYAGNRNGIMYAINAETGVQEWQYKTNGSITFSAASSTDNTTIYIASNDSYGYAFNATDGTLRWKTEKLPGAGFLTWWPVVTTQVDPQDGQRKEYVILSGSENYKGEKRVGFPMNGITGYFADGVDDLYRNVPSGTYVGPLVTPPAGWPSNTKTYDASNNQVGSGWNTTAVTEYFENDTTDSRSALDPARREHKPWRRSYLVFEANTGTEYTTDFDHDNQKEYAPILWAGATHSGNRYPPVVGADGDLYEASGVTAKGTIPAGSLVRWRFGTPFIGDLVSLGAAVDQPQAFSGGGTMLYINRLVDVGALTFSTILLTTSSHWQTGQGGIPGLYPDYDTSYVTGPNDETWDKRQTFGGINGVYGKHGSQNAIVPYKGRLYTLRGNSLIALKAGAAPVKLPFVSTIKISDTVQTPSVTSLELRLEREIQKIIQAGHLNPGWISTGIADGRVGEFNSEDMLEYWHHPFETLYILLRVRPYITNPSLLSELDSYIDQEWNNYPPYTYNHIGWVDGSSREAWDYPPEIEEDRVNFPKSTGILLAKDIGVWNFNPMSWYVMWQYAEVHPEKAVNIFNQGIASNSLMNSFVRTLNGQVTDAELDEYSWAHNGYIAGFMGFIHLHDMVYPSGQGSPVIFSGYSIQEYRTELDRLLRYRVDNFSKNSPYQSVYPTYSPGSVKAETRVLNTSRNYIFMVPKLAEYLSSSPKICKDGKVMGTCASEAVDFFNRITPYWFVSRFDNSYDENLVQPLYDYHSFQAKAQILGNSYEELSKYLDVPAVARGDLFYIDNLVSLLEAPSTGITVSPTPNGSGSPTPTSTPSTPGDTDGDTDVDIFDYNAVITDFGKTGELGFSNADFDTDGDVDIFDYNVVISNFGSS